jgi:hypothetical protein
MVVYAADTTSRQHSPRLVVVGNVPHVYILVLNLLLKLLERVKEEAELVRRHRAA